MKQRRQSKRETQEGRIYSSNGSGKVAGVDEEINLMATEQETPQLTKCLFYLHSAVCIISVYSFIPRN